MVYVDLVVNCSCICILRTSTPYFLLPWMSHDVWQHIQFTTFFFLEVFMVHGGGGGCSLTVISIAHLLQREGYLYRKPDEPKRKSPLILTSICVHLLTNWVMIEWNNLYVSFSWSAETLSLFTIFVNRHQKKIFCTKVTMESRSWYNGAACACTLLKHQAGR